MHAEDLTYRVKFNRHFVNLHFRDIIDKIVAVPVSCKYDMDVAYIWLIDDSFRHYSDKLVLNKTWYSESAVDSFTFGKDTYCVHGGGYDFLFVRHCPRYACNNPITLA